MKAIILAAGIGRRLKDVSNNLPKPLFEVSGLSILDYSLEALGGNGIDEIVVVIGYRKETIMHKFGHDFKGLKITYVENPIFANSGSMHSLYLALEHPQNCLVLDGDLVFNPEIIPQLLQFTKPDAGIIVPCTGNGDEVFTVTDEDYRVMYLGKQHPGHTVLYEFAGITKLSEKFVHTMIEQYQSEGDIEEQYEIGPYRTSKILPWYGVAVGHGMWSEIDSKDDIERAEQVVRDFWNLPDTQQSMQTARYAAL